jgi:hypothetical protein
MPVVALPQKGSNIVLLKPNTDALIASSISSSGKPELNPSSDSRQGDYNFPILFISRRIEKIIILILLC